MRTALPALLLGLALLLPACAAVPAEEGEEGEESIALADVPAAVLRGVEAALPGIRMESSQREEKDGAVLYEVSGVLEGAKVDVTATAAGEVLEVERTVPLSTVPAEVRAAAAAAVPGAVFESAEHIRKKDAWFWELKGRAGKRNVEVLLSAAGEVLEIEG